MLLAPEVHTSGNTRLAATARFNPTTSSSCVESAGFEELLHQRVVGLGNHLDERLPSGLRCSCELAGDGSFSRLAAAVRREGPCLHRHEIDDAAKILLFSDWQLDRDDRTPEDTAQRFERASKVGALAIEPVEDNEARRLHLGGHAPDLLGRDLDAGHGVDDDEGGIGDAQRGTRVAEEVRQPRGIDEVDLVAVPLDVGEAGGKGVLAGDFFFVEVGDGGAVVDAAETVHGAGGEQQRGEQLRLAGAAMTDQGDISQALSFIDLHGRWPPTLPASASSCQLETTSTPERPL